MISELRFLPEHRMSLLQSSSYDFSFRIFGCFPGRSKRTTLWPVSELNSLICSKISLTNVTIIVMSSQSVSCRKVKSVSSEKKSLNYTSDPAPQGSLFVSPGIQGNPNVGNVHILLKVVPLLPGRSAMVDSSALTLVHTTSSFSLTLEINLSSLRASSILKSCSVKGLGVLPLDPCQNS